MDRRTITVYLLLAISCTPGFSFVQTDVRNWPKLRQWMLIKHLIQNYSNPSKTLPVDYNLHCLVETCVQPTTIVEQVTRPIVGWRVERDFLPSTDDMYDRQCQPVTSETDDYRLIPAFSGLGHPVTQTRTFRYPLMGENDMHYVTGHVTTVNDPRLFSVLEPGGRGGCARNQRQFTRTTSRTKRCLASLSAGFFDAFTGSCIGNIYSEGRQVSNSSIRNAHFGVTENDELFFGYLGRGDVERLKFRELVNGMVWLVKDGVNAVDISFRTECIGTAREEEDAVNRFLQVSARAAVGHDKEGRILIVNVDGKTYQSGMNLYELGDFLITLGVQNAVNFDGGGSVTLVLNGTVANQPADLDTPSPFMKTRKVMTVICTHAPYCPRERCHKSGTYMVDEECLCYS